MNQFKNLSINHWKQFEQINIDFHPRLTILTGANGSGKTTLLNLLARHFGWHFVELATPKKDSGGVIKWTISIFKKLTNFGNTTQPNLETIGNINYSNGQKSDLIIQDGQNGAQYQINIQNQQHVNGLNIVSHRAIFRYQQVGSIQTTKRTKQDAYQITRDENVNKYINGGNANRATNFSIKETLLSWAIGGSGNEYIEADPELKRNFDMFQEVLRLLMPKTIGFTSITIRNYEIVLITDSGEFMIDAVSGGVASIIDLAWQIYNFSNNDDPLVVLIDEVENHLHPTMQRSILPDLIQAFPKVQFIVSTHSPLAVGSVKDSNVFAFRYNEQNKVYSEKLDLVNKAKTATEILNEVLGVPFSMPIWVESELNNLVADFSAMEITEENVNQMRKQLKEIGLESLMPLALVNILRNDKA